MQVTSMREICSLAITQYLSDPCLGFSTKCSRLFSYERELKKKYIDLLSLSRGNAISDQTLQHNIWKVYEFLAFSEHDLQLEKKFLI